MNILKQIKQLSPVDAFKVCVICVLAFALLTVTVSAVSANALSYPQTYEQEGDANDWGTESVITYSDDVNVPDCGE